MFWSDDGAIGKKFKFLFTMLMEMPNGMDWDGMSSGSRTVRMLRRERLVRAMEASEAIVSRWDRQVNAFLKSPGEKGCLTREMRE